MKTTQYQYLIGKEKSQVIENLGTEFNYHTPEIWFYYIRRDWIGKNVYLFILFKNEKAYKLKIKKSYAKIRY